MNIILLSGGSGKRLWPLSNDIRSKQFIKLLKKPAHSTQTETEDTGCESMMQRVYRQIKTVIPNAVITIATSRQQVGMLRRQLGADIAVSVEPGRRDTFPAVALTAAYLHDVGGVDAGEPVVVCPVDPYVEDDYFTALRRLGELAQEGTANLVLMGIHPTYPSEKYGYILPTGHDEISRVTQFKEKPDAQTAAQYIEDGGLWNGGVFACKLSYLLAQAHKLIDFTDYADLFAKYDTLPKISFDYAVVEHEPDIAVLRFSGQWKDMGTWNTLTEAMEEPAVGEVLFNDSCSNVHVINELGVPVLAMGLRDMVISASPEGILVSDKEQSSYIKPFIDEISRRKMFAPKDWGGFRILDKGQDSLTVKVMLHPGHRLPYHSHEQRDEIWTVISGRGRIILNGAENLAKAGDVVRIAAGCRHTIIAETELQLIEIRLGTEMNGVEVFCREAEAD